MRPSPLPDPAGKRPLDVIGALIGLALLAPLLLLVAAAIRATSRGPALFAQERTGRGGRPFRVLKFRTMAGPATYRAGKETRPDDPRITTVGRWLRRSGIDELPQLVNVLRGEMSLVGPRPLLAWENALCDDRQARRLLVRPGITGLSQVNGRNAIPWADRIDWDLAYVGRQSLALDLAILLRTVPTVLLGRDAYALPPAPPRPAALRPEAGLAAPAS